MRLRICSLIFILLLLLPSVLGFFPFFSFPPQPPAIFRRSDVNGEDVNVHFLWADVAWITQLFSVDVNVTDFNVTGDINATGSLGVDGGAFIAEDLIVGGDANFENIGVKKGIYANRINATGDSNFSNIGISGNAFLDAISSSSLTAGRMVFVGTSQELKDDSDLTYSTTTGTMSLNTGQLAITGKDGVGADAISPLTVVGGNGYAGTYAGGGFSLTSGAGGASTGPTGGAGGAFDFISGDGGGGTGAGGDGGTFTFTGGNGGASTYAVAGDGGGFIVNSGTGGGGTQAGLGGPITMTSGAGADGTNGPATAGGAFTMTSGTGGAATSVSVIAGTGGFFYLTSGTGGLAGGNAAAGGIGGNFILAGGVGGASAYAAKAGGMGGNAYFNPGAGGINSDGGSDGADGILGFCVNPTTGIQFGKVGIGTKNPSVLLDVNGNTLIRGDLNVLGDTNFLGNVSINGTLFGGSPITIGSETHFLQPIKGFSPLNIREGIKFIDINDNNLFRFYIKGEGDIFSGLSGALDKTLIIETNGIQNPNRMEVGFCDTDTNSCALIINEGSPLRATFLPRSVMIGKNKNADINSDTTLCDYAEHVDCDTPATGADLLVEDDIEARGNIYAGNNIYADGNILGNSFYGETHTNCDENTSLTEILLSENYYQINDTNSGTLNGFSVSDGNLIASNSGTLLILWSASFATDIKNNELKFSIFLNDAKQAGCSARQFTTGSNEVENISSNCIINVEAGDKLTLKAKETVTEKAPFNIATYNFNLTALNIGS